jgi:hypothetical protein
LDQQELDNDLYDAYTAAQGMLSGNVPCIQLFGTDASRSAGWDPATVLGNLFFGRTNLGSVGYGPTLGAEALTSPTFSGLALAARININASDWIHLSKQDRGLALLHELGHAYNILFPRGSGGSAIRQFDILPPVQVNNQTLVAVKCGVI